MVGSTVYAETVLRRARIQSDRSCRPQASCILLPCKSFRINTSKSLSKQATLTIFEMKTYGKRGGGEVIVNHRKPGPWAAQKLWVRGNPNGRRLQARRQHVDDGDGQ